MGRGLAMLGALLLLVTVSVWIADVAGVLSPATDTSWTPLTLKAGLGLLAAGLILRLVSPATRQLGRGRCAVCGHPIERGHTYCSDHMQEMVNTYRDQSRERMLRGGKSHS